MWRNITMSKLFLWTVLVNVLVENFDDGHGVLVVMGQRGEMFSSLSIILKNTIKMCKTVKNKELISLNFLNNFKHSAKHTLHLLLFLLHIKKIFRIIIVKQKQYIVKIPTPGCENISLCSSLLDSRKNAIYWDVPSEMIDCCSNLLTLVTISAEFDITISYLFWAPS